MYVCPSGVSLLHASGLVRACVRACVRICLCATHMHTCKHLQDGLLGEDVLVAVVEQLEDVFKHLIACEDRV